MSQGQPPALAPSGSEAQQPTAEALAQPGQAEGACQMVRKEDLGCAICLETLKDPFVTACGKYRPPPPPLLPLTPLPAAHLCRPHCSAAALNCIPCTLPTASQIPPTSPPHLPAGHTFCYACLSQHLLRAKNCPACSHYLATDLIFPNFLLSKVSMGCTGMECDAVWCRGGGVCCISGGANNAAGGCSPPPCHRRSCRPPLHAAPTHPPPPAPPPHPPRRS